MQDNIQHDFRRMPTWQTGPLFALVIVALGFALRVHHLASQSLWYDEAFSVYLAGMGLGDIIARTAADIHPPLYYFLLHGWMLAVGSSEFALRFLSLIFGVLTVPLFFQVSRRLLRFLSVDAAPPAGIIAAAMAAIAPFYVWYSQEGRMYTLLTFLGALSSLLLLRLLAGDVRRPRLELVIWVAVSVAAVYTHFYGFFLLGFQLLYVLWRVSTDLGSRLAGRDIVLAAAAVVAAYLPWLGITFARFGADASYWEGVLDPAELLTKTFLAFAAGLTATTSEQGAIVLGYSVLLAFGLVTGVWVAVGRPRERRRGDAVIFPLVYLITPIVLLYLVSFDRPKFDPRYLMLASPGFYLLAALGLEHLASQGLSSPSRSLRGLARSLLAAGIVFVVWAAAIPLQHNYANEVLARDDFRSVAGWVRDRIQPDEAIILCSGHMFPAFEYYFSYPAIIRIPDQPTLSTKALVTYAVADELNQNLAGKRGVWLVLWQDNVVDPDGILTTMLQDQGVLQPVQQSFWGLRLFHYALPPAAHFSSQPGVRVPLGLNFADAVRLLGYRPSALAGAAGESVSVTLYWQPSRALSADYRLLLRVVDDQGNEWGRYEGRPAAYEHPTTRWQPDAIVPGSVTVPILAGTPPGDYHLQVAMYPADNPQRLEIKAPDGHALGQSYDLGLVRISRGRVSISSDAVAPPIKTPLHSLLAPQVELVGHDFADVTALPGDVLHGTLLWRAVQQPPRDFGLQLRLVNAAGQIASQRVAEPAVSGYPSTQWQEGEFVRGQVAYVISYDTPAGEWQLQAALTEGGTTVSQPATLARIRVNARPGLPQVGPVDYPLDVALGQDIVLKGFAARRSATTVTVTLYWLGLRPMETTYQVFVHLLDASGTIIAQHDGVPAGGGWPTTAWPPGSLVTDIHSLVLRADSAPGPYRLAVGVYEPVSGQRLPVAGTDDGRLLLGPLTLP
ncbi:MAG: glycosyltransferase family 39 protein [Chloroflexota bacterium]|nr:glycosyltransferase family 39 protein [Chloroflexota bacterium]